MKRKDLKIEERGPTNQEKTLFDLLMKAGTDDRLFMTVARLDGKERAIIAAQMDVHGETGFIPIGIVITADEMRRMTVSGASPTPVDIRDTRRAEPVDPVEVN